MHVSPSVALKDTRQDARKRLMRYLTYMAWKLTRPEAPVIELREITGNTLRNMTYKGTLCAHKHTVPVFPGQLTVCTGRNI